MITRYHSHVTNGLLCLEVFTYDAPSLLGRLTGGRAACKSFVRMLYVVMHTSYSLMYEHNSSLLASGAEISSSLKRALPLLRVVVVLEWVELNFAHPS